MSSGVQMRFWRRSRGCRSPFGRAGGDAARSLISPREGWNGYRSCQHSAQRQHKFKLPPKRMEETARRSGSQFAPSDVLVPCRKPRPRMPRILLEPSCHSGARFDRPLQQRREEVMSYIQLCRFSLGVCAVREADCASNTGLPTISRRFRSQRVAHSDGGASPLCSTYHGTAPSRWPWLRGGARARRLPMQNAAFDSRLATRRCGLTGSGTVAIMALLTAIIELHLSLQFKARASASSTVRVRVRGSRAIPQDDRPTPDGRSIWRWFAVGHCRQPR